jgi:NADH:ubiquinone oxidoreductase subunit
VFSWWGEPTWGTRFLTWRKGRPVGEDSQGNRYFEDKGGGRRWVLYAGEVEASRVPPAWNAWLQRTVDEPPAADAPRWQWQKAHQPNRTGSAQAYRPPGNLVEGGRRDRATGDYEPWRP